MRAIFALFISLFLVIQTLSGQVERSVVQAFNAKGIEQVILNLPGDVELLPAPGELIQIETAISLTNAGAPILKALIHAMRYSLTAEKKGGDLYIQPGNRLASVTVRGLELQEQFRFKVYLPKGVQAAVADPIATDSQPYSPSTDTNSK